MKLVADAFPQYCSGQIFAAGNREPRDPYSTGDYLAEVKIGTSGSVRSGTTTVVYEKVLRHSATVLIFRGFEEVRDLKNAKPLLT